MADAAYSNNQMSLPKRKHPDTNYLEERHMQDDIPPTQRSWNLRGFTSKWFVGRALGHGYDPETTVQPVSYMLVLLIAALLTIALVGCELAGWLRIRSWSNPVH